MKWCSIVYLDTGLIADIYTDLTSNAPTTKITKSEDVSGGIGAGVFRLGGTSRETREYTVSSIQMYFAVEKQLDRVEFVELKYVRPQKSLFWTSGILAVGRRTLTKSDAEVHDVGVFTITGTDRTLPVYVDLATKDDYFTSGFDRMAADKDLFGHQIWEPVKTLLRPAFTNSERALSMYTPIVMLRDPAEPAARANSE